MTIELVSRFPLRIHVFSACRLDECFSRRTKKEVYGLIWEIQLIEKFLSPENTRRKPWGLTHNFTNLDCLGKQPSAL